MAWVSKTALAPSQPSPASGRGLFPLAQREAPFLTEDEKRAAVGYGPKGVDGVGG